MSRTAKRAGADAPQTGPWLPGRLAGKVAVVLGASRGAGRGIALALGDAGATVYVAGRTARGAAAPADGAPGSVEDTADEVSRRGGRGVAVRADCSVPAEVAQLFARVEKEEGGLDVLANAVWGGNEMYEKGDSTPFWEGTGFGSMLLAGGYAHLLPNISAAPLMIRRHAGLIVHVTEPVIGEDKGARLFWTLWGLGHRGINRMVDAMSRDLKPHKITVVALAPGFMRTERVLMHLKTEKQKKAHGFEKSESTEYVGRAVAALATDAKSLRHTGKLLYVGDLARQYGFTDVDGQQVPNFYREVGMIK